MQDGSHAIVDLDIFESAMVHIWSVNAQGYAVAIIDGASVKLHDFVTGGAPEGREVDHANRNPLDNRHENLRFATKVQQGGNRSVYKSNTSGFKGVCLRPSGKWRAKCAGEYLGEFSTAEAAAKAYDKVAFRRWGEYANLNLK